MTTTDTAVTDWQYPFTDIVGRVAELEQPPFKVPETVEELRYFLQAALALEHLTIPPYLTAMYTLKPGTNREAFYAIRAVVLEEMLHMTLVANLINAVGGKPVVAHPDFVTDYPVTLPYAKEKVPVALRHFGPEALRTFLFIERPEDVAELPGHPTVADDDGWTSIGQFYNTIRQGLLNLASTKEKERKLFDSDRKQVGPEDFFNSGGEVFEIHDLATALKAIRVITEQGEGVAETIYNSDHQLFGEAQEPAHFFRFMEIYQERKYGPHDTPYSGPTGPALVVSWEDAYPIPPEATVAEYPEGEVRKAAGDFNVVYARLLLHLQAAYDGEPKRIQAAVPAMLELRDLAEQLYRNPHPDEELRDQGLHACPTYEIYGTHFGEARSQLDGGLGGVAALLTGLS
ncbi:ferritin-like protein [Kitasatospora atroaurantiaca]|uniref:Ferritin-like protein n=1 Tax=Kitasatospora atroaurantiaca TaxID=285545 RepID=A0A561ELY8_9ACTN|nr:ferritin-like protein [Kitasatospora atroaurantiaca]TWE16633.1 ferritin-like protein [Kitasatospora atroaurantiaca]